MRDWPGAGERVDEAVRAEPSRPLRGMIAAYDGYRQRGVEPAHHLGLPSPFLTVIFTLHEPLNIVRHVDRERPAARYDALIGGLHAEPVLIAHEGEQSGIQLRVSPLAARALFGVPAGELGSLDMAAEELLGADAERIRERLLAAEDWPQRFAVLDRSLCARASDAPEPPRALAAAWRLLLQSAGSVPVSVIAREVGWSERQLGNRFREEIGLSPKTAARVVRFHRARHALQRQLAEDGGADIARTAAGCGYYDQSHMIRDFHSFAGIAPSHWLREEFRNVQARTSSDDLVSSL